MVFVGVTGVDEIETGDDKVGSGVGGLRSGGSAGREDGKWCPKLPRPLIEVPPNEPPGSICPCIPRIPANIDAAPFGKKAFICKLLVLIPLLS